MAKYKLNINNKKVLLEADPDMPLLWAIRDLASLKGTKYGCGMAQCGACTVHLNGKPIRSCSMPLSAVKGKITTIEGLSVDNTHPMQVAWIAEQVPQCGYCQSGQIMTAAALLRDNPHPSEAQIDQAMMGNICRCGTYPRIKKAILSAQAAVAEASQAKTTKQS